MNWYKQQVNERKKIPIKATSTYEQQLGILWITDVTHQGE